MNTHNIPERRHFHRIVFDAPAQIEASDEVYNTSLLDISLKGALLKIPRNWQPFIGEQVTLKVMLDQGEHQITMQASCSHIEADRIGLLCKIINMESITELRRLVELNLCDDGLLQRELEALG
jgi:hypothetical protein